MSVTSILGLLLILAVVSLVLLPLFHHESDMVMSEGESFEDDTWIETWLDRHFCGECGAPREAMEFLCAQCGAPLRPEGDTL
ncbi:hypothetical protein [Sulfobacillus harzensis]|uniref:Uncharacterized protein n=1 Tax=Sulfobacillus harzensis TaxID=2729629 RepID=A0A7Y0L6D8_9FIRM|nr:hypothetical protein [Sulfobacillus harzensis]NMP23576.1 hypothetical protein [Sulfobacillus harzensis]